MQASVPEQIVSSKSRHPSWWSDVLLISLFTGMLFLARLGTMPLANPDEGRYAEIAREMLVSGDWVTPRLNEVYYFEKPPFVYWVTAASMAVFGQNAWAARLPNALLALAGVLITYGATRRLFSRDAGLAAALVLATSLLFFALGRILILDMAVSVFMAGTLFCFILALREPAGTPRRLLFYGLYASAALATLSKGLIGFLVTGAVMFLWLLIFNQWRRLRPLHLPTGLVLFLAIAAPWHLLAARSSPVWANFYFVHEHWLRFTTTTHGRYEPWWYFVPILLAGLLPWTGYLWQAVRSRLSGGWAARATNADAWFLLTWIAFIFLFFSRSQSKLAPYILPIFPALAAFVGAWIAERWNDTSLRAFKPGLLVFSIAALLLGTAAGLLAFNPSLLNDKTLLVPVRTHLAAVCGVMIAGVALTWYFGRVRGPRRAFYTQVGTFAALFLLISAAVPVVVQRNTKALADVVAASIRPGDRVYHYHGFFHDFVFYTGRPVGTVSWPDELELDIDPVARASGRFVDDPEFLRQWNSPERLWVVARKRDTTALFALPAFRYHLIAETGSHYLFSNFP